MAVLLRTIRTRDRAWSIVKRGNDDELARLVGVPVPNRRDLRSMLSPREKEIFDLLCQGAIDTPDGEDAVHQRGYRQVHTHHIFDKTNIRSRTALALHAAREQLRQATSAMSPLEADEPDTSV